MEKRVLLVGEPMGLLIANEVGALEDVGSFTLTTCGAEFNVAVGMTRLGSQVTYMTKLGDDPFGKKIIKTMKNTGISTDQIILSNSRPTGFMLKEKVESGDPGIFYFRKGSAASSLSPSDIEGLDFSKFDMVHLTGITPALSESCRDMAKALNRRAKENGCLFSFDPNLRPQLWPSKEKMIETINGMAAKSDVFFPGINEAKILIGESDPEKIAERYIEAGAKTVIVKVGAKGAYYADRHGESGFVDGFPVTEVVDTVGAGDGFAAGVLTGLREGASLSEAVRLGCAIGAIQVMSKGDNDGLPYRDELDAFMKGIPTGGDKMSQAMELFFENGILPVVVIDDEAKAVPLAGALLRGGISAIEITLRTDDGVKAIERIRREVPEMYVGAGTVITVERAKQAVQAGAQFIISPGLNVPVIQWCQERNIPVFPGVATPSEVEAALNLGLHELKFFPAEAAGGVPTLRAFASPYPMVKFLPTGGIGLPNMMEYLALPNVLACGGSWLCPQKLLAEDRFDEVERLTRQAVTTLHGFSLSKFGFACGVTDKDRDKLAVINEFSVSPLLECEDAADKGSIEITVNDLDRAKAFLERRGFLLQAEEGRMESLQFDMAGYSIHLEEKKA